MKTVVIAIIILVFGSSSIQAEEREFRLGVISDKPAGRIKEYSPVTSYVAKRLEKLQVTRGKLVVAKDLDALLKKIAKQEVDVVLESPFPTIQLQEKAGMKPELLVWKKGRREYRSLIFVRKESPINKLQDLVGKTIVFEDSHSTSAYLLPKAELITEGLKVIPLKDKGSRTAVNYVFGGEETNEAFWVLQKKTDAGAFSSDDWKELSGKVRGELRVIHESKPVLRFVASFHPALPTDLKNAVMAILMQMHDDPEGRRVLRKGAKISIIERLSEQDRQSLQYVQELANALER